MCSHTFQIGRLPEDFAITSSDGSKVTHCHHRLSGVDNEPVARAGALELVSDLLAPTRKTRKLIEQYLTLRVSHTAEEKREDKIEAAQVCVAHHVLHSTHPPTHATNHSTRPPTPPPPCRHRRLGRFGCCSGFIWRYSARQIIQSYLSMTFSRTIRLTPTTAAAAGAA